MTTAIQPQNFQQYEDDCRRFVTGFKTDNPTAIVQYVRFRNRQKRGVIVAFLGKQGEVRAGFSLCNTKKERRGFSPLVGLRMAIQRSRPIDEINWDEVPHGARVTLGSVCERARKYFSFFNPALKHDV